MIRPSSATVLAAGLAALWALSLVVAVAPFAGAAAPGPVVQPATTSAAPGAQVFVDLVGWPSYSSLTVETCGNGGVRGSQDCDQIGAQSIEIRDPALERVLLTITRPPMPCPCVLRVNDLNSTIVVSVPFDVVGVPTAPIVPVDPTHAPPPVTLSSSLRTDRGGLLDRAKQSLGGAVDRHLLLHVTNVSGVPLSGVVVSAAVGRRSGSGEAIDAPAPFDLAPGASHDVLLPVDLHSPTFGTYHASGSVFASGRRVPFDESTRAIPWALVLVVVVVLVDVGFVVGLGRARRRALEAEAAGRSEGPEEPVDPGQVDAERLEPVGAGNPR